MVRHVLGYRQFLSKRGNAAGYVRIREVYARAGLPYARSHLLRHLRD
jgi:hypothetical protein